MQFEDFDHKVREAARQHQPANDEAAWEKMQLMLEKHLPEKKDDRRPLIFFLLLFLLLGGGVWLMVDKPWKQSSQTNTTEKDNPQIASGGTSGKTSPIDENRVNEPIEVNPVNTTHVFHPDPHQDAGVIPDLQVYPISKQPGYTENKNLVEPKTEIPAKLPITEPVTTVANPDKSITTVNPFIATGDIASAAKKDRKIKRNSFSFSLTTGFSSSSSEGGSLGRIKSTIGAGVTYTIRDKFSIRSGFYSGHKVYVSEPYEYHPPDVFWTYYPNLQQVDADCKVYEIPLSLVYHFGNSSRQNWFAGAGVSSYIMKKETYKFLYKNSSGQLSTRTWNFDDKNQHLFSTLTISGGYQRSLGKTFSVSIEPYLKLPISGVGYGKVKLSSVGALLTVDIKTFGKR